MFEKEMADAGGFQVMLWDGRREVKVGGFKGRENAGAWSRLTPGRSAGSEKRAVLNDLGNTFLG